MQLSSLSRFWGSLRDAQDAAPAARADLARSQATSEKDRPAYRSDIDGLRAVAVLPVVAYHAGIHIVRGGFVGVDIFFVISGFLITQLLVKDIQLGKFSIITFYDRRIRRILPALIPVLLAAFLFGLVYCLPAELVDLSKSLIAAALSASNIYFWFGSGYFDGPALSKPLLHTWSLAVEEQFYIFWPIFLYLGHRFLAHRLLLLTSVIVIASLIASSIGALHFPNATFYLPFTRIWELGCGGLLALGVVPAALNTAWRNCLSALGMVLIVPSVFLINADMPFPGLLAVPPCLGAVLIILAGRDGSSWVGRILSWRPFVLVGLISYSLYLWHWPITVFQKNYSFLAGGLPDAMNKLLIIVVSIVAAFLSWRFVEQPFRTGKWRPSTRLMRQLAAGGTALVLVCAITGWSASGFPARYTQQEIALASYLHYDAHGPFRYERCYFAGHNVEWKFAPECLTLSKTKRNVLLLGDSHAAELWSGLKATYGNVNFLQASASDCFPTIAHSMTESAKCIAAIDPVLEDFLSREHVDDVMLIARWKPALLGNVAATLDWLRERHIHATLVGPTPVFDAPVPRLMVSAVRNADPALPQRHMDSATQPLDAAMAQLAAAHGAGYVSLLDLLCSKGTCLISNPGQFPIVYDQEHFTSEGSAIIAQRMALAKTAW